MTVEPTPLPIYLDLTVAQIDGLRALAARSGETVDAVLVRAVDMLLGADRMLMALESGDTGLIGAAFAEALDAAGKPDRGDPDAH